MKQFSLAMIVLASLSEAALAQHSTCPAQAVTPGARSIAIDIQDLAGARLIVRLEDPPRTRVTLSIDNDKGNHHELVWDPAVRDGLQHEVVLEHDKWRLTPSSDYERVEAENLVLTYGTMFGAVQAGQSIVLSIGAPDQTKVERRSPVVRSAQTGDVVFSGGNTVSTSPDKDKVGAQWSLGDPALIAFCAQPLLDLSGLHLDRRKVIAASTARGLLDTAAPKVVVETLEILAEVAVERAKSGAMEVIRERVVEPLCTDLTRGIFYLRPSKVLLLPRTCSLLQQLRLEDVLGSGHALLASVEFDLRELLPVLVEGSGVLDEQAMEIISLALRFASHLGDGQADGIIEVDYLVALLDQVPWSAGFDRSPKAIYAWLSAMGLGDAALRQLKRDVMKYALPEDFDAVDKRDIYPWSRLTDCQYKDPVTTFTGASRFTRQLPATCAEAIAASRLDNSSNWINEGIAQKLFTSRKVYTVLSGALNARLPFSRWFDDNWTTQVIAAIAAIAQPPAALPTTEQVLRVVNDEIDKLDDSGSNVSIKRFIEASCGVRLVVGAAKRCSSREQCTAGEIATILKNPEKIFAPTTNIPGALCWRNSKKYRLPLDMQKYTDLAARLVAFLNPAGAGQERTRMLAMTKWMFDVAAVVLKGDQPTQPLPLPGAADTSQHLDETLVPRIQEIAMRLDEGDHISALMGAFMIAKELKCKDAVDCELPSSAIRAAQLFGAVASYAQVYRDTKTLDPAAAKEARKNALMSLIDAATDRRDRGSARIISLGSNVGFSSTWSNEIARESGTTQEFALRVPLGLSFQCLPYGSARDVEEKTTVRTLRYFGTHFGFQFADLGHFVRHTGDSDVTWSSFVAPGIEAGVLFGQPNRLFTLVGHASYVPSLVDKSRAMWRFGVSFGYYVPFFDLN